MWFPWSTRHGMTSFLASRAIKMQSPREDACHLPIIVVTSWIPPDTYQHTTNSSNRNKRQHSQWWWWLCNTNCHTNPAGESVRWSHRKKSKTIVECTVRESARNGVNINRRKRKETAQAVIYSKAKRFSGGGQHVAVGQHLLGTNSVEGHRRTQE